MVYSTYVPGVSLEYSQLSPRLVIRVDSSQNVYVAGPAEFTFPTTAGAFQTDVNNLARSAFVLELNPSGTKLVFSTLIGGSSDDLATGLALTGDTVTIAGISNSFDFPATDHSMPFCNVVSIPSDFYTIYSTFFASFDHTGKLLMSSEYSNCEDERVVGIAEGSNKLIMPYTFEAGDGEGSILTFIDPVGQLSVQMDVVADAASFQVGAYCPLEILTIVGKGLGPKQGVAASPSGGLYPTKLAGTQLEVNGAPAPLLYVSDSQINAVVPGHVQSSANLVVVSTQGASAPFHTGFTSSTPEIFSINQTGIGQGAILNQDGTVNSASNPAARGAFISIFGTGGGQTTPGFADGQIAPGPASIPYLPYLTFDNVLVQATYAGAAPSLVNGVLQVNVQVPVNVLPGPAVSLLMSNSRLGVTVAVK